jgi:hypothetical protein
MFEDTQLPSKTESCCKMCNDFIAHKNCFDIYTKYLEKCYFCCNELEKTNYISIWITTPNQIKIRLTILNNVLDKLTRGFGIGFGRSFHMVIPKYGDLSLSNDYKLAKIDCVVKNIKEYLDKK